MFHIRRCTKLATFFAFATSSWVAADFFLRLLANMGWSIDWTRTELDILDKISIDCDALIRGRDSKLGGNFVDWKFDTLRIEEQIIYSTDRCATVKKLFHFGRRPLTQEEAEFPLAYGVVVYKDIVQLLFMLSSFYQPQNEYCLAVSGSASSMFKYLAKDVASCWPNVHFVQRGRIFWGSFEIINATYSCMELLTNTSNEWKYFQYLSGVDAPLKTNLEMVRILKTMNMTFNSEIKPFQPKRLKQKRVDESPLPLFKSSLSALVPRPAANAIAASARTAMLLAFLNGTNIPDEGFWSTLGANKKTFPIPGSLDGHNYLKYRSQFYRQHSKAVTNYTRQPVYMRYYMARYQVWMSGCKGKVKAGSCVFGVGDLPKLVRQPHLVAHKFYMDFQPAAFFCILKEIRRRTLYPSKVNAKLYSTMPQVELSRGVPFEELTNPLWLF